MILLRPSEERGHFNHGWLETYHTFSFADYDDPRYRGFRNLRVINEDWVAPGEGFPTHAHRDMEIITCVLEGSLQHKDSMGNGSIIKPGDVQRMSAGTGVTHSEYNASAAERVHLLQIWILPEKMGLKPEYEQRSFPDGRKKNQFCLVASGGGNPDVVKIHQNVKLFVSLLDPGKILQYSLNPGRYAWIQIARGAVQLNGARLRAGDGAAVSDENTISISAEEASEILLFDLL